MTLCLAWKQGSQIHFASDSRLTDGDGSITTEDASKVFKIGVVIYGPIPSERPEEKEPLIHQSTFGLCFAGSYLNGSILAGTIEEVLSNIQATPYSDISIENLSNIAFAVYKQVSTQLMQIHCKKGLSRVMLGGYCPITSEFKIYLFSPKELVQGELLDFEKQEIVLADNAYFIGDSPAIKKAVKLSANLGKNYTYFHILRDIIRDREINTVGGNIQCGLFTPTTFKTYGLVEYSTFEDEYGITQVKDSYKFRGLSLDLDDNELRSGNIHIHKAFFNPFEHERNEYFEKSFESIDKSEAKMFKKKNND
jgi:hypothetical protein